MRQMEDLIDATTTTKQARADTGFSINNCNGDCVCRRNLLRGELFPVKQKAYPYRQTIYQINYSMWGRLCTNNSFC